MNTAADHRAKLRRLRILQALSHVAPNPMGEQAVLSRLRADPELEPDLGKIRSDLGYLAWHKLVDLVQLPAIDWRAGRLSVYGKSWLEKQGADGLDIYSPDYLPPHTDQRGRKSTLQQLDPEARAWIDQELAAGRMTYTQIAEYLQTKGYEITRSAVGRYGKRRKDAIAAVRARAEEKAEIAKALAGVFSDEADIPAIMHGALGTALVATVDAITAGEYNSEADTLAGLVKALPALGRGFRQAEQHKIEREARRAALEEAAERVDQAAQARGLSADDARFWREKVLMGM